MGLDGWRSGVSEREVGGAPGSGSGMRERGGGRFEWMGEWDVGERRGRD